MEEYTKKQETVGNLSDAAVWSETVDYTATGQDHRGNSAPWSDNLVGK